MVYRKHIKGLDDIIWNRVAYGMDEAHYYAEESFKDPFPYYAGHDVLVAGKRRAHRDLMRTLCEDGLAYSNKWLGIPDGKDLELH